jgi:YXWGXW repeat-containing protein
MNAIQKIIYFGFATTALASASLPAFSWTVWPDVDFEWYANVGKPMTGALEAMPAPRPGYIWAPGRHEWTGTQHAWKPGVWIKDDYFDQVAVYHHGPYTFYATGPLELRDRDGNVIPITPEGYPIDSARR